jgi:hypothetical protein
MLELNKIWYESIDALASAYPSTQIHHASVQGDIPDHFFERAHGLPRDAAAHLLRNTSSRRQYDILAQKTNNAEFGKALELKDGRIAWAGAIALHAVRAIPKDNEILATRGYAYWCRRGVARAGSPSTARRTASKPTAPSTATDAAP